MKKLILFLCLSFSLLNSYGQEKIPPTPQQRPPGGGTDPCGGPSGPGPINPPAECLPIDDNIAIYVLLAAGLLYGAKRIRENQLT